MVLQANSLERRQGSAPYQTTDSLRSLDWPTDDPFWWDTVLLDDVARIQPNARSCLPRKRLAVRDRRWRHHHTFHRTRANNSNSPNAAGYIQMETTARFGQENEGPLLAPSG